MDKIYEITMLFDFYGELLTDKQRAVFELYYLNDLSLYEISEQYGITRQAVLDMIKRTEKLLHQYEDKLHLTQLYIKRRKKIDEINKQFDDVINNPSADKLILLKNEVAGILD